MIKNMFMLAVAVGSLDPAVAVDSVSGNDTINNYIIQTVSTGDYFDLLNSIDSKLDTLNSVFYWSWNFSEMGIIYQVLFVIAFAFLLKVFIDFMNWR